jgi:hypothetical protein
MSHLIPFITEILLRLQKRTKSKVREIEELLQAFYGPLRLNDTSEEFSLSC